MKHTFKYHIEDLPELEKQYQETLNHLREQRDLVAGMRKDEPGHQIETSMLLSLNRRAEELKGHIDHLRKTQEIGGVMTKLDAIIDKNNCLRVRFYDWLAAKLEKLAARIRTHATNISRPCVVKFPAKKDEPESIGRKQLGMKR